MTGPEPNGPEFKPGCLTIVALVLLCYLVAAVIAMVIWLFLFGRI